MEVTINSSNRYYTGASGFKHKCVLAFHYSLSLFLYSAVVFMPNSWQKGKEVNVDSKRYLSSKGFILKLNYKQSFYAFSSNSGAFWILKYLFFPNITLNCIILIYCILNAISAYVGEPMSVLEIVSILAQSTLVSIQLKWGLTGCTIFELEVILAPLPCWRDHELLLLSIPEQAISLCSSFFNFWWVMLQPS